MNLVDSSGWLEYFAGSDYSKNFAPAIEDPDNLIVSVINLYEVYKKVSKAFDETAASQAVALMQSGVIIPLTPSIVLLAAQKSLEYQLPMADSLIYTTAITYDAVLWTQDSDFVNLPGVKYFPKD